MTKRKTIWTYQRLGEKVHTHSYHKRNQNSPFNYLWRKALWQFLLSLRSLCSVWSVRDAERAFVASSFVAWLCTQGGHIKNFLGRRYTTQNRTINVVGRCLTNVILEKVVSLRILEMLCLHFFWVAEMGCCGYRIPRLESQWLLPTVATGQEGVWCRRMGEFEAWTIFVLASYVVRGGAGPIACMSALAATTKKDQKTWMAFS